MAQNLTYQLKHPVTVGTETITEVVIGAIKGKHMRSLPGDPKSYTMGVIMDLAAKVTGQSSVVIDEMHADDLMEVCGIVGERLGGGQEIGPKA